MSSIIEFRNLTKKYGDFTAVDNISFSIEEGTLFAFLGPNGAGKSTAINIACTLLAKTSGSVTIGGFELSRADDSIRNLIGVVFQESLLDELLTVRENLQIRAGFYKLGKQGFIKRLDEISDVLGISGFLNKRYGLLSGGQKRRADIARALINTPRILFLDEPTTGLDPQTRVHVWETIKTLQKKTGMTVFLTTHYMEEAAAADFVTIIDHGTIVASGTPSDLRVRYSKDHLKVIPIDSEAFKEYLLQSKITHQQRAGSFEIPVENSLKALKIIKECESMIENFEVICGSMDDVFISITGKNIREEGEINGIDL